MLQFVSFERQTPVKSYIPLPNGLGRFGGMGRRSPISTRYSQIEGNG